MRTFVLFIQGGGEGAHEADALLAKSLQQALGHEYDVRYPEMPDESNPDMQTWKTKITRELESLDGRVMLVGHSLGGVALLKFLSEENIAKPIAGLFLLAVPSWDEENWNFDNLKLPRDLAAKLLSIPQVFLYHNRDDEIAPFRHLALHAARFPHAIVREGNRGGHQFGNDLAKVASDIEGATQADKTHR
jgi:predicted alpha/beta hydrolase family esterase